MKPGTCVYSWAKIQVEFEEVVVAYECGVVGWCDPTAYGFYFCT